MAIKHGSKVDKSFSASSMTDLMFLLLLFLLIATTLINPNALKLMLPKSSNQLKDKAMTTVSVQDAGHGAVQHGLVQRAAAHGVDEPAVVDPLRAGHLQLKAGGNALDTVVHRAPVGHDKAVKAPRPAQNVGQQRLVLARIGTVEPVVAAHHGPGAGLFYGSLKGGQIDLLQGALVHTAVHRQAAGLLIVGGKMLDACAYALALHTVDEPCG